MSIEKKLKPSDPVTPVFSSIEELARGSDGNKLRYEALVAQFEEKYAYKPKFVARAPGRVNIIGVHVDYSGYGVLPMATEQDIAIAFGVNNDSTINFFNTNPAYSDATAPVEGFAIDGLNWHHYFLCGYKGVVETVCIQNPVGIDILLNGNIPPSAGLSSSSALVCCAVLVTLVANGVEMPSKKELAELCAHSERYIGTEGGGMDQAICFLAEQGQATMVKFNPIVCTGVELPEAVAFVISNTLVEINKATFSNFNERVMECRLAAQVIAKKRGLEWKSVNKLLSLQEKLTLTLKDMPSVVTDNLHSTPYFRQEICDLLELTDKELELGLCTNSKHMQTFELHNRAMHVYQEAARVIDFKETANSGKDNGEKLGALMNDSHTSCSKLYDCSCSELDELVALCKASGALVSRHTGAGFGGCVVSMVYARDVPMFIAAVGEGYYKGHEQREGHLASSLFATKPGPGAAVCKLSTAV